MEVSIYKHYWMELYFNDNWLNLLFSLGLNGIAILRIFTH